MNLIQRDPEKIATQITSYLEEVILRARRQLKTTNYTKNQHTIPRFILKHIAAEDPKNADIEKNLYLQEYKINYNPHSKVLGDWVKEKHPTSLKLYSSRDDIYESPFLEDENFLESIISAVETDAARMIRARIRESRDSTHSSEINPFYFYLNLPQTPNKVKMRVILSTFFSLQLLRAEGRRVTLSDIKNKHSLRNLDFATNILDFLIDMTIETYNKQWLWARMPNHEVLISELGKVTVKTCSGHSAGLMPLSRRDFIYFSDEYGSHFSKNDKIAYSNSSILNDWLLSSIIEESTKYFTENNDGNYEIKIAINQKANLNLLNRYRPNGCCFSCILRPAMDSFEDKVFLVDDQLL